MPAHRIGEGSAEKIVISHSQPLMMSPERHVLPDSMKTSQKPGGRNEAWLQKARRPKKGTSATQMLIAADQTLPAGHSNLR